MFGTYNYKAKVLFTERENMKNTELKQRKRRGNNNRMNKKKTTTTNEQRKRRSTSYEKKNNNNKTTNATHKYDANTQTHANTQMWKFITCSIRQHEYSNQY